METLDHRLVMALSRVSQRENCGTDNLCIVLFLAELILTFKILDIYSTFVIIAHRVSSTILFPSIITSLSQLDPVAQQHTLIQPSVLLSTHPPSLNPQAFFF